MMTMTINPDEAKLTIFIAFSHLLDNNIWEYHFIHVNSKELYSMPIENMLGAWCLDACSPFASDRIHFRYQLASAFSGRTSTKHLICKSTKNHLYHGWAYFCRIFSVLKNKYSRETEIIYEYIKVGTGLG